MRFETYLRQSAERFPDKAALIASGDPFTAHPALAVAAGSLAGLFFNFTASKKLVFRRA